MEVGEECLTSAHPTVLGLDGLLDFEEQVCIGPDLVGAADYLRARRFVIRIADR